MLAWILCPAQKKKKEKNPSTYVRELQVPEMLCLVKCNNNTEGMTEKIIIIPETGTR